MGQAYRVPKRTILCIDDDDAILTYERRLLEKSGFVVLTAPSAQLGLTLAMKYPLDAVILDYHMPEMNGHQVAAAIRRFRPETLIVMFSASDIPDETRKLADAVVPKMGTIRELLVTVAELCDASAPS